MAMTISGSTGVTYPDGSSQSSGQQACKAWVNFNGTGTVAIRASFNVTSITDLGSGDYIVNFTIAMADADYCANVTGDVDGVGDFAIGCLDQRSSGRTTSAVRVRIGNSAGGVADSAVVCTSVFR